ncbi:MAG: NADH-quinone oxidoreductase subunit C [Anaerolineae bacterium]|nr:NADH-quinone oxidoreductase subunit C [Anaerolineae bacterium]
MHIPPAKDPVSALQDAFGAHIRQVKSFRDETTVIVDPTAIVDVMLFLRNTPGLVYNFLSDISAVDYYEETGDYDPEARFGVSYHIYSMLYNRRLRIKVLLEEEAPSVPSIVSVWPAANWLEREIMDMMGVRFEGHPDPRRLLMPEDWDGHPHRRDYPLGKETVQFSFNVEEILRHKPFARE